MMRKALVLVLSGLAAAGCAHRPVNPNAVAVQGVIVDGKGKDRGQIMADGDECAGIAQATAPANKAVTGAIAGAVFGALLGAATYRAGGLSGNSGATYGSAVGALTGGASGAGHAAHDYRTVLRNCMIGRGHIPLN